MVPASNSSGNYFEGRPNGWEDMEDSVFVVSLLTAPGNVTVNSGGSTQSFNAPAGATAFQVPMAVGQQQFSLTRGSTTVLSGVSLKDISSICICGIYNFNAYVGTLPSVFQRFLILASLIPRSVHSSTSTVDTARRGQLDSFLLCVYHS